MSPHPAGFHKPLAPTGNLHSGSADFSGGTRGCQEYSVASLNMKNLMSPTPRNPSSTVSPGLGDGNYVVRATSHNGVKTVLKTRF